MSPNPNLKRLHDAGVSIWLDTLSRDLLQGGEFQELIDEYSVTGATSNPTIFAKALSGSDLYDDQIRAVASSGVRDTQELFFALALDDIREAARLLRPTYDGAAGHDGLISFECTPDLADDTDGTLAQAKDLWQRLDRPNVMIKVPGTKAGLPAIEELTRSGVNVNITLLFSIERYEDVIDAYLRGLTARAQDGQPIDHITSVASFFLSRIDTKVDAAASRGLAAARPGGRGQRPRRLPALPRQVLGACAGRSCAPRAPSSSCRCGRARAPRTRRTPTRCTSPIWSAPT